MSRSWILVPAIAALLGSSSGLMGPVLGQIPYPYLSMSVRPESPANTCDNAPSPCEGPVSVATMGRYEFDIYRVTAYGTELTDLARFYVVWPAGWSFVSAEFCYGTLISGNPSVPYSNLEVSFPDCPVTERPFLRIVLDCPVPGSFRGGGELRLRVCETNYWVEEFMKLQCDVGDWCGRLPNHSCDWCSLSYRQSAYFDPPSFEITLPSGQNWSGFLSAWGNIGPYCGGAPECGEGYGSCLSGLHTDVPWMTTSVFWPPRDGYYDVPYILRIDTDGLAPGRHEGNIVTTSVCGWCIDNCMPVTLQVLDPAAVEAPSPSQAIHLDGPYPNPATDRLQYAITVPSPAHARVAIYDVAGRRVADLLDRDLPAGTHPFAWSRETGAVPSGAYILRLEAGAVRQSRLILLAH